MQISKQGVLEISELEGIALGPYLDINKVWTYGVGHTAAAGGLNPEKMKREDTRQWSPEKVRATLLDALKVFDTDLDDYESRVNDAVKVPLKQHQFDALVSFDFNTGGIFRAKLTQALNAGDYAEAAERFMGWLKPKAIIKRRTDEMNLFVTGSYSANGSFIGIWDTLPDGSIKWRGRIDSNQLAALMRDAGAKRTPAIRTLSKLWRFLAFWK